MTPPPRPTGANTWRRFDGPLRSNASPRERTSSMPAPSKPSRSNWTSPLSTFPSFVEYEVKARPPIGRRKGPRPSNSRSPRSGNPHLRRYRTSSQQIFSNLLSNAIKFSPPESLNHGEPRFGVNGMTKTSSASPFLTKAPVFSSSQDPAPLQSLLSNRSPSDRRRIIHRPRYSSLLFKSASPKQPRRHSLRPIRGPGAKEHLCRRSTRVKPSPPSPHRPHRTARRMPLSSPSTSATVPFIFRRKNYLSGRTIQRGRSKNKSKRRSVGVVVSPSPPGRASTRRLLARRRYLRLSDRGGKGTSCLGP